MQHNLQQFADGLVNRHGQPNLVPQSPVLAAQRAVVAHPPRATAAVASTAGIRPVATTSQSGSSSSSSTTTTTTYQRQHQPVTKEDLGRATWTFLHTLAAQFPEHPTRQQQRDARQLIDSLTRIYPCADCAQHFQDLVRWGPAGTAQHSTAQQSRGDCCLWIQQLSCTFTDTVLQLVAVK
jgi:hypothetical protein